MDEFWEKVEHYNSKLITPALIVLFVIIIIELFVHIENPTIELILKIADALVILVFIIDLVFLAKKARSMKFFFKNYWLDILAVFPFVLFFNVISSAYEILIATERITLGQALLHETVEAGRGATALTKTAKFTRVIRIVARSLRFVTKSKVFNIVHHKRRKKHIRASRV